MAGNIRGRALLVNACVYSVNALLNQQSLSLDRMSFDAGQNNNGGGVSRLDTAEVEYTTGSMVYGKLGAQNTLELYGQQFASSGSPRFTITVNTTRLPPATSTVYLYIFYNTVVATDGAGQRAGISVASANKAAAQLMAL